MKSNLIKSYEGKEFLRFSYRIHTKRLVQQQTYYAVVRLLFTSLLLFLLFHQRIFVLALCSKTWSGSVLVVGTTSPTNYTVISRTWIISSANKYISVCSCWVPTLLKLLSSVLQGEKKFGLKVRVSLNNTSTVSDFDLKSTLSLLFLLLENTHAVRWRIGLGITRD